MLRLPSPARMEIDGHGDGCPYPHASGWNPTVFCGAAPLGKPPAGRPAEMISLSWKPANIGKTFYICGRLMPPSWVSSPITSMFQKFGGNRGRLSTIRRADPRGGFAAVSERCPGGKSRAEPQLPKNILRVFARRRLVSPKFTSRSRLLSPLHFEAPSVPPGSAITRPVNIMR